MYRSSEALGLKLQTGKKSIPQDEKMYHSNLQIDPVVIMKMGDNECPFMFCMRKHGWKASIAIICELWNCAIAICSSAYSLRFSNVCLAFLQGVAGLGRRINTFHLLKKWSNLGTVPTTPPPHDFAQIRCPFLCACDVRCV